ncbi:MAG: sugar nucleotide-binding protein [Acidimicrobiales bacterium]|nr:sugar nucleotide-binding protein [Acidimicrobiales bacterium]
MRVLVTGGAGLLGARLAVDVPAGVDLHCTWHRTAPASGDGLGEWHEVDLADHEATAALVAGVAPDLIIHTAYAMADGDRHIVAATAHVADAAAALGAGLVHLSSDVVFDGEHAPYAEADPLLPISPYGRHKAEAEAHVRAACPDTAVVRTSLITWANPFDARTAWIVDTLRAGDPLTLFTDEIRCPVRLDDLSAQLWDLAALDPEARAGAWHLVGSEALSRHELGVCIARHAGLDPAGITAASSHSQPVPRPRDLHLTTARADAALPTPSRSARTLFPPR